MFRSDIEQALDQDSSKMQAKLKYIPIEQLVHYAGKKVILGRQSCHLGEPGLRDDIQSSFAGCLMKGHCTERMKRLASSNNGPYPGHGTWEGPVGPRGALAKSKTRTVQVMVDILGVMTAVGPMRSIKRKQDGTEFFCRDVTIADAG